ncbi:hypothetical protein HYV89_04215 [Candidatus Woesearchaeota archaeon]|nr:hypothetical protein [Candidatus Woesearchaeota archaeon]
MALEQLKSLEQHVFEISSRNLPEIKFQRNIIKVPIRSSTMITEIPITGLILYAFYDSGDNLLDSNTVTGRKDDYEILVQQCKKYFHLREESQQDT